MFLSEHSGKGIRVAVIDSGVHAAGQVIAFDFDWQHTAADLAAAYRQARAENRAGAILLAE